MLSEDFKMRVHDQETWSLLSWLQLPLAVPLTREEAQYIAHVAVSRSNYQYWKRKYQ